MSSELNEEDNQVTNCFITIKIHHNYYKLFALLSSVRTLQHIICFLTYIMAHVMKICSFPVKKKTFS